MRILFIRQFLSIYSIHAYVCTIPYVLHVYMRTNFSQEPCPFGSGLRKFALDPVVVIFFKIPSGGLILSLGKFGLIPHSNFLQKIFM